MKQNDTDTAVAIINQHLGIPTKVRLLRITVSSEHDKAIILRNSTKLRFVSGTEYLKKVF